MEISTKDAQTSCIDLRPKMMRSTSAPIKVSPFMSPRSTSRV